MRSMDKLDNGIFEKRMVELIKELRFRNYIDLLALSCDVGLLNSTDVRKLLTEAGESRIGLLRERYEERYEGRVEK